MARRARARGFRRAERLTWGRTLDLAPDLSMRVVPSGRTLVWPNNAYVFATAGGRAVFFGGEMGEVAPLERHRADLALLPVNGLRPLFWPRLITPPAAHRARWRAG